VIPRFVILLAAALLACLPLQGAAAQTDIAAGMYVSPRYDGARNPAADLRTAMARARFNNRNILLEVGGDWCVWCHILDRYIADELLVRAEFAASFVVVKVNVDPKDREGNAAFLAAYPDVEGYPGFIILGPDGALLGAQDTGALEKGPSYDKDKMIAFARRWRRLDSQAPAR
jgi:thiol:disulfide interchange protein